MLSTGGWRGTYVWFAGIALATAPLLWLTIVDRPSGKGPSWNLERGDSLGRYIILGPLGSGEIRVNATNQALQPSQVINMLKHCRDDYNIIFFW